MISHLKTMKVLIAVVHLIYYVYVVSSARGCRDLPEDLLPEIVSDLTTETSKIMPYRVPDTEKGYLDMIDGSYVDIVRTRIHEVQEDDAAQRAYLRQCSTRSTCQWHYVRNYDINRRPVELTEARCTHRCCNGRSRCSELEPKCKPIMYYVPVLRRSGCNATDSSEGYYTYTQIHEPLGAGCTCTQESSISDIRMPRI